MIEHSTPPARAHFSLPPLPPVVVRTTDLRRGQMVCSLTIRQGGIGTLGGPSGAGKSTTVAAYLREHGTAYAYVQLPQNARVRGVIALVWEALTGHPSDGIKQRDLENDLVGLLSEQGTCVIADEVHNVGVLGMQALRYLHDRVVAERNRGLGPGASEQGGFPLLLVGTDVAQAIRGAEELDTRAGLHHEFETIPKDLVVVVVRQMDPRLAATQARTLEVLNARYCKGNLRRWRNLLKNITDLRAPGDQTGITVEEAKDLLTLAGKR